MVYVVEKIEKTDAKKIENISSGQNAIFPEGTLPGNVVHGAIHFAAQRNVSNYVDIGLNKQHTNILKTPSYTSQINQLFPSFQNHFLSLSLSLSPSPPSFTINLFSPSILINIDIRAYPSSPFLNQNYMGKHTTHHKKKRHTKRRPGANTQLKELMWFLYFLRPRNIKTIFRLNSAFYISVSQEI